MNSAMYRQARLARDSRFDGQFYIGVTTTGIFCRPICPAVHLASEENVQYFHTAYEAFAAGLRPCLRCRPEAAPGSTDWLGSEKLVKQAYDCISEGFLSESSVAELATRLNISERYLRKLFQEKLGISPLTLANSQKVLFAKQLLNDSHLSITDIAYASGFNSLRQFNTAFKQAYRQSPSEIRKIYINQKNKQNNKKQLLKLRSEYQTLDLPGYQYCRLLLPVAQPFSWEQLLAFYQSRLIPGVECISNQRYCRTIRHGQHTGYLDVGVMEEGNALEVNLYLEDITQLMPIKHNLNRMFDLDSNIQRIYELLKQNTVLARQMKKTPCLRLPGSWCAFETAIRAIVNQQISIKATLTVLGRIVKKCGTPLNPFFMNENHPIDYLFPTPQQILESDLTDVGMPKKRQETLYGFCRAIINGDIKLDRQIGAETLIKQLCALPGIGEWTANYIVMRGLSEPDAFPYADLGLMKALNCQKPKEVKTLAEAWRPWRAYAAILLWQSFAEHS